MKYSLEVEFVTKYSLEMESTEYSLEVEYVPRSGIFSSSGICYGIFSRVEYTIYSLEVEVCYGIFSKWNMLRNIL